jgi:OmpA-OmpF porin, OOP family
MASLLDSAGGPFVAHPRRDEVSVRSRRDAAPHGARAFTEVVSMNSMRPFLLLPFLGALVTACSAPLPPTQSARTSPLPDAGPTHQYHVVFPDEGRGEARYIHLTLGDDMALDCGLTRTHFEFDSAEPLPQDRLVLKSLAACLDRPKYLGVQLSLVGRADSRGSEDYNVALALRRAVRVKVLLVDAGMAEDRIKTASRGDRDSVGDDMKYSYGYDRRVDAIIPVVHAPR